MAFCASVGVVLGWMRGWAVGDDEGRRVGDGVASFVKLDPLVWRADCVPEEAVAESMEKESFARKKTKSKVASDKATTGRIAVRAFMGMTVGAYPWAGFMQNNS